MDRFSFLFFILDKENKKEYVLKILMKLFTLFPFSFQVDALVTQLELQTCRTILGVLKDTVECQIQNFFIFYSPGTGFEGLRILLRIERSFVFFHLLFAVFSLFCFFSPSPQKEIFVKMQFDLESKKPLILMLFSAG